MMEPIDFKEYKRLYFEQKKARQARIKKKLLSLVLPIVASLIFISIVSTSLAIGLTSYYDEQRRLTVGYQIEDCSYVVNEEGDTVVTVTFVNDALDPFVFTVERGVTGESGNFIDEVTAEVVEDTSITFTISYTDETFEDTVITLPLVSATDGRFVTRMDVTTNSNGIPVIIFVYSDGTESDPVTLTNGFTSKYGVTISAVESSVDSETGTTIVTFIYSYIEEGEEYPSIEILKGERGNDGTTIKEISAKTDTTTGQYVITVILVDYAGTETEVVIALDYDEVATYWYYGNGNPNNNGYSTRGKLGDFYFDTENDILYCRETFTDSTELYWNLIFEVHGTSVSHPDYCLVTYDLNGGVWENSPDMDRILVSSVKYNDYAQVYFSSLGNPYYEGKTFIGWYSYSDYGNPNAGKLDTLTPIVGDITVYAWFE